jgi:hypothetical protein
MKPILSVIIICLLSCALHPDDTVKKQSINLEPVIGEGRLYSCAIVFRSVSRVYMTTHIPAASLGHPKEMIPLGKDEWRYDAASGQFEIQRDIDNSVYTLVAEGAYTTPIRIILNYMTDPSSVRFAIDGRIGKAGVDYRLTDEDTAVDLPGCVTGDENYMIQWRTTNGVSSVNNSNPSLLTRKLRAYFELPLDGNTVPVGSDGSLFSPRDGRYRSIWLVELIPLRDGYAGKNILTGFSWNAEKNELKLSEPVDLSRFSVYVFGEE